MRPNLGRRAIASFFFIYHYGNPQEKRLSKGKRRANFSKTGYLEVAEQKQQDSIRLERLMLMDLFKLPFARLKPRSGTEAGMRLEETTWLGYDALVGAVSDSINTLYSNDFVSEMIAQSFMGFLHMQRFSRALAGAMFAGLLPAVGMPTSYDIGEVRKELADLRNEIRSGQTVVGRRDLHHSSSEREAHVESGPAARNPVRTRTPAAA